MLHPVFSFDPLRLAFVTLLVIAGACGDSNQTSPSDEGIAAGDPSASAPVDSAAVPADSATPAPDSIPPSVDSSQTDSTGVDELITSSGSGIPFGQNNLRASSMTAMYN